MVTAFTTEPKLRRHAAKLTFVSGKRALLFMEHLYGSGLKNVSYSTLSWEFMNFFKTNDRRTVERYLGRPEIIERDSGLDKVFRINRISGKIALFEYMNERRLPAKKGLLEILGYVSKVKENGEWRYILHHERLPYYTVQTELKLESQEAANSLQELEREGEASKDNLCACTVNAQPHSLNAGEGVRGKGVGENPIFCEAERGESVSPMGFSPTNMRGESAEGGEKRKKEEVIGSAHTNLKFCIQNRIRGELVKEIDELLGKPKNCKS